MGFISVMASPGRSLLSFMGMSSSDGAGGNNANGNLPPLTSVSNSDAVVPGAGVPLGGGQSIGAEALESGGVVNTGLDTDDAGEEDLEALKENCQYIKEMMRNMNYKRCDTHPEMRGVISQLHDDLRAMLNLSDPGDDSGKSLCGNRRKKSGKSSAVKPEIGCSDSLSSDVDSKPNHPPRKKRFSTRMTTMGRPEDTVDSQLSRSLAEALCQFDNRRAPKPEDFDLASGRSFDSFLESFEEYCLHTFRGSSSLWCSELRGFLKGSILQTYDALHTPGESYEEIKEKLIQWCDDAKESVNRSNRKKFDNIHMKKNESLRLYAARVERQFRLSYPRKRVGSSSTLIRRFVETVPSSVRKNIMNAKSILSIQGQDLDWKLILKLVSGYEMEGQDSDSFVPEEPEATEVWAVQPPQPPRTVYSQSPPMVNSKNRESDISPPTSPRRGTPKKVSCFYCKRPGHIKSECWRFNRRCLACGSSDHRIANCPDRRSAGSSRGAETQGRSPRSHSRRVTFSASDSDDTRQQMGNTQAPTQVGTVRRS